jgi:hypothetical protein
MLTVLRSPVSPLIAINYDFFGSGTVPDRQQWGAVARREGVRLRTNLSPIEFLPIGPISASQSVR